VGSPLKRPTFSVLKAPLHTYLLAAVSPDGTLLYVTNNRDGTVSGVDVSPVRAAATHLRPVTARADRAQPSARKGAIRLGH
jgi:DNA-binding beta-propeller fold protein YncE